MDAIDPHSTDGPGAVRPASPEDIESIAALYAHYVAHSTVTFDLEAPAVTAWNERWRAAQRSGHPWFVADDEHGFAGYATASEFRPKRAYRTTVETTIYLRPDATGRGLGGRLYAALLAAAQETGFHLAVVLITLPNPESVAMHERLGFDAVGVMREVGHKLGAWRDVGIWQRALGVAVSEPPRGPAAPA